MKFCMQKQIFNSLTARWPNMEIFELKMANAPRFKVVDHKLAADYLILVTLCTGKQNSTATEVKWQNIYFENSSCQSAAILTSSSAVAKRPRDALCLSVVSFNSTKRRAQSFIAGADPRILERGRNFPLPSPPLSFLSFPLSPLPLFCALHST